MALSRLGAARITSLGDNTVESKTLNAIYDQVAKFVMSKAPWPSVKVRVSLAQTVNTPSFGYDYEYQLPVYPKFLRLWRVNEYNLGDIDFRIEADKLISNETTISILYSGFLTDTELYDVFLEEAIILRLAYELSYSRTGEPRLAQALRTELREEMQDLINNACSQEPTEIIPSDLFVTIRGQG